MNYLVRKQDPFLLWNNLHEILLDSDRIRIPGEIEPLRDALNVSVHYDAGWDAVSRTKNYIRRFARRARDGKQLFHCARDVAVVIGQNFLGCADERSGFVVEESSGANLLRKFSLRRACEIARRGVFLKKPRSHFVYALIRTLRGQDRRNQQLPGIFVLKRASGGREKLVQRFQDSVETRGSGRRRFRFWNFSGWSDRVRGLRSRCLRFSHSSVWACV